MSTSCYQLQVACNRSNSSILRSAPFSSYFSRLLTNLDIELVKRNQIFEDDKDDPDNLDCRDMSLQFCSQRRPLYTMGSHLEAGELAVLSQVLRVVLAVVHWRPLHLPLLRDPRGPRGSGSERRLHISGALVRPAGGRRLSEVVWSLGGPGEIGLSLERPA